MALSSKIRQRMLENGFCVACNFGIISIRRERDGYGRWRVWETEKNSNFLTIDHIVPISRGGTNHQFNLMVLCERCNGSKGNQDPWQWLHSSRMSSRNSEILRLMILAAWMVFEKHLSTKGKKNKQLGCWEF